VKHLYLERMTVILSPVKPTQIKMIESWIDVYLGTIKQPNRLSRKIKSKKH
jgi:hypothetical protein